MRKQIISICLAAGLVIFNSIPTQASSGVSSKRLKGNDRYKTAVEISKDGWKTSEYVVVAGGEKFPDALCSVPLAKKYNAPILLTKSKGIDENTLKRIKELRAKNIIIVGGNGAVSKDVEEKLKSVSTVKNVERIWGGNRYATSESIANKLGSCKNIVLTSGENYADALSIASIAASKGMPILLTEKNKLNAKNYIDENSVDKAYILGGEKIISKDVENVLKNPKRIFGKNRFETNAEILKSFSDSIDFKNVYVAVGQGENGNEFADALSGSALAAKNNSPMVLTYGEVSKEMKDVVFLNLLKDSKIVALGGEKILKDSTVESLKDIKFVDKSLDIKEASNLKIVGDGVNLKGINIKNNIYIKGSDLVLEDAKIKGKIYVDPGKNGQVKLKNVETNKIEVLSGGEKNIHLDNVKARELQVKGKENTSVKFEGNTEIDKTNIMSSANLEVVSGNLGYTVLDLHKNHRVTLKGKFSKTISAKGEGIIESCKGSEVSLKIIEDSDIKLKGEIKYLDVPKNAKVDIKDAKVKNITGDGKEKIKNEDKEIVPPVNPPINPTEPTNPTEPIDPTNPAEPIDPTNPAEPENPKPPVDWEDELKEKDYKICIDGNNVTFYINKDKERDYANIIIYMENSEHIKYIDETRELIDGKYVFKTVLDKGYYNGRINGKSIKAFKVN